MRRRVLGGVVMLALLVYASPARGRAPLLALREIVPGVRTFIVKLPAPNVLRVVEISPKADVLRRVASAKPGGDRLAPTSVLCGDCLVAVNGGFFDTRSGLPVAGQWPVQLASIWKSQTRSAPTSLLWLIKDGKTQALTSDGFTLGRHPRTFAFGGPSDRISFVTVDGRQPGYSLGMTLPEVTAFARGFGATWAVNLDGGCSTTFVIRGRVRNSPCQDPASIRGERPVANAFVVLPPLLD